MEGFRQRTVRHKRRRSESIEIIEDMVTPSHNEPSDQEIEVLSTRVPNPVRPKRRRVLPEVVEISDGESGPVEISDSDDLFTFGPSQPLRRVTSYRTRRDSPHPAFSTVPYSPVYTPPSPTYNPLPIYRSLSPAYTSSSPPLSSTSPHYSPLQTLSSTPQPPPSPRPTRLRLRPEMPNGLNGHLRRFPAPRPDSPRPFYSSPHFPPYSPHEQHMYHSAFLDAQLSLRLGPTGAPAQLNSFLMNSFEDYFFNPRDLDETALNEMTDRYLVPFGGVDPFDPYNAPIRTVGATTKQISQLRKFKLPKDSDDCCCVCLDEMKKNQMVRQLKCVHHFHVKCIDKWLKQNRTCPVCKVSVGEETRDSDS